MSSCLQSENSFSEDSARFGHVDTSVDTDSDADTACATEATARFESARSIFQTNCVSCHAAYNSYSEARWVSIGYVAAGDPAGSEIYSRLRGSNSSGVKNMPPVGQLSAEEFTTIETWITRIDEGSDCGTTDTGSGEEETTTAAERTAAALQVLATSCNSCHTAARTATSSAYLGSSVPTFGNTSQFSTDSDFVIRGLISVGDAENSWLFRVLKTHGDIATMPKNAEAISDAAATILEDWINGIGED